MKKCKCEEYKTCDAEISCMYDFIGVQHSTELGTVIIEDLSYDDKVILCEEHIPQLIAELEQYVDGGNSMIEYLVTYYDGMEIIKCLFYNEKDAQSFATHVNQVFECKPKATITKVKVVPVH